MKTCTDLDEDCDTIHAEGGCLDCWLYDPAKGMCPYLRPAPEPAYELETEAAK